MVIYKITNTITGKIYIGLTSTTMQERWTNHKSNARNRPERYTSALYASMRKHGVENFIIEQIDTAETLEELNIKEQTYIKALNTLVPFGYNLGSGGGAQNCHPETRAKIAETLKGRPIKNRMNGAPKGRPVSEARRKQISETLKGVPQPSKYKPVLCVETGVQYPSVQATAEALGIDRTLVLYYLKSGKMNKKLKVTLQYVKEAV